MATYRPASENDIATLVPMMQDFYAIDGYPIDVEKSASLFRKFIREENLGKSWLIASDGDIAGYVIMTFVFSFEFAGTIAFVDELYIKDGFRGKGIGKETIDFVKSEAEKRDLKILYLEVEHHNSNAKKLYLDKGFSAHKRQLLVYKR
ncbi:GNAT family N-acetyltransferase [Flavobacterium selenitireducens]|uniref:GNAT family N-acetyltransferase n=1 Tax=Flavobacterium selenitireducens TaxID=2722704 RepID=UPI001CC32A57|nr:GNAT family N-acetyltransferase [Flavobacterium selenitireducens]